LLATLRRARRETVRGPRPSKSNARNTHRRRLATKCDQNRKKSPAKRSWRRFARRCRCRHNSRPSPRLSAEIAMALKRTTRIPGKVVLLEHTSKILADNPLGDPHVRNVGVYLPPQYDEG